MSVQNTACPLDCYDACEISFDNQKIQALKSGHTQGFLCPHLNHYEKHEVITQARYKGQKISMQEALLKLKELINANLHSQTLHYRGNGNFALMQAVTDHFFASIGAVLTDGTLCDGAGEAGIIEGRGSNKNMPLSEIAKSDVVIFWGRNPHVTSSHLLPLLKDKKIIVIDPLKTKIAKMADLYIQIKPHSDIYLAMLIIRFLHINGECDEKFLQEYASEFKEFYELTQSIRIKATLEEINATLGDIGQIIEMVANKRVAIVCGLGIQKYSDGADVMRSIDALAVALGLFGKEGSGVAYLGNSKENIVSPFYTKAKRVSKVDTSFDDFKTVFIQGANPLSQMPNSLRVQSSLSRVENVIYFGLYENETSAVADLVIPAKDFLAKEDIRTSYSHHALLRMHKQRDVEYGISEYDLSAFLCREFGVELKSEAEYLAHFESFAVKNADGSTSVKGRENRPYQEGFDTDDGEFVFLEEFEQAKDEKGFFLITSKSAKSLNSQFKREKSVYLHSSLGFAPDEEVKISSNFGDVILKVQINDDVREDCVLIYSGTRGVNNLTSSRHSLDGKCAIYQEEKVEVVKL